MEQYYNHLTDRLEDLEPFMAKTLPRTKEEYLKRLEERERPKTYKEAFGRENPLIKVAKEYLDAHPEEVIKLRDEGLVKEMQDFADKSGVGAIQDAPTEEEVYLAKREREGRQLEFFEESGKFPVEETWNKLKEVYRKEEEKVEKGEFEGGHASTYPIQKVDYGDKKPFEPSRYMLGTDPYSEEGSKPKIGRVDDLGRVEYLEKEEDIIEDEIEPASETISKYIIYAIIVAVLIVLVVWSWT